MESDTITAVECERRDRLLKVSTTPTPDGMIEKDMESVKKRGNGVGRGEGGMVNGSEWVSFGL